MQDEDNILTPGTNPPFHVWARSMARQGFDVVRHTVEWMVRMTNRYPRAVVYGLIGFVLGGLFGPLGSLLLAVAGAGWGWRKAAENSRPGRL